MHSKYGIHLLINELEKEIKDKDIEIKNLILHINKINEDNKLNIYNLNKEVQQLLNNTSQIVINSNNIKIENIHLKNEIENLKLIYDQNIINFEKAIIKIMESECNKRIGDIIKYNYLVPKKTYLQ